MSKPIYVEDLKAAQMWFFEKLGSTASGVVRMTIDDLIWFLGNRPDLDKMEFIKEEPMKQ